MKWEIIISLIVGALLMWGILAVVDSRNNLENDIYKNVSISYIPSENICASKGYTQIMRIEEKLENNNNYMVVYSLCENNDNKIKIYELKTK